eukprot:NODE_17201_length_377_cov_64.885827_g16884_i0.p1 GENE.NODE_17201_length_377_cov_64.885827_g16884_i0~~NODE_17201_length_377_cov_64.885827_g16884_i0.p1  ORF type:complete len:104 (-),score=13.33 NODE_17201_length_377_cov_64.885827_g16884_i0:5-316(-)
MECKRCGVVGTWQTTLPPRFGAQYTCDVCLVSTDPKRGVFHCLHCSWMACPLCGGLSVSPSKASTLVQGVTKASPFPSLAVIDSPTKADQPVPPMSTSPRTLR